MDESLRNQLSKTFKHHRSHVPPSECTQQEKDCAIVVPAQVSFGNVAMHLDLKIDQRTFAAASGISKAFEDAVCSRISAGTNTGSDNAAAGSCSMHLPSTQSSQDLLISPNRKGYNCSQCTCTHDVYNNGSEQVNEVCSSTTVDTNLLCDTACSPISIEASSVYFDSTSHDFMDAHSMDPRPSSTAFTNNSNESCNQNDTSTYDPSPSPVDGSPFPIRRRCYKVTPARICDFKDTRKGQCRQRAIMNYSYCIRHILNDPTAPYRRCEHKRKPKSKNDSISYCTNAVRKDKGNVLCTTHMIMTGQKEKKPKKPNFSVEFIKKDFPRQKSNGGTSFSGDLGEAVPDMKWRTRDMQINEHNSFSPLGSGVGNINYEQNFASQQSSVFHGCEKPEVHHFNRLHDHQWTTNPSTPVTRVSACDSAPIMDNMRYSMKQFQNNQSPNCSGIGTNKSVVAEVLPISQQICQQVDRSIMESNVCRSRNTFHNVKVEPEFNTQRVVTQTLHQPLSPQLVCRNASSNLSRQHPQLAAKLLEQKSFGGGGGGVGCVSSSVSGSAVLGFNSSVSGGGGGGNANNIMGLPQRSVIPAQNQILPSYLKNQSVPIKPNYYMLSDDEGVQNSSGCSEKFIKLKQKKRKLRIDGWYRNVKVVNEMCQAFELFDADEADLFPLGLEPSDDEDELSENEHMLDMYENQQIAEGSSYDPNSVSSAISVYMLKKQLRLDKRRLWHLANRHAVICEASRYCSLGASHALYDRSIGNKTTRYRQQCMFKCRTPNGHDCRCTKACLPYSNLCRLHIGSSTSQVLYGYCAERGCNQSFLRASSDSTNLCQHHSEVAAHACEAQTHLDSSGLAPFVKPDVGFEPMLNSLSERDPFPDASSLHASSSLHPSNSATATPFGDPEIFEPNYGICCVDDFDITFGAGRDFEGQFERMLDGLHTDNEVGELDTDNPKNILSSPSHNLGHTWDDIEQFLISEGYNNFSYSSPSPNDAGTSAPSSILSNGSHAVPHNNSNPNA